MVKNLLLFSLLFFVSTNILLGDDKNELQILSKLILLSQNEKTHHNIEFDELLNSDFKNPILKSYIDIFKFRRGLVENIGFIKNYALIGPFENSGDSGFSKEYPVEKNLDLSKEWEGKNQKTHWKPINNYNYKGFIQFKNFINPKPDSLAYLLTYIKVKKDGVYQIRLGSGSRTELFLNGEKIINREKGGIPYYDQHVVDVKLSAGTHSIVVKVGFENYWGIYLRLTDSNGFYTDNLEDITPSKNIVSNGKSSVVKISNQIEEIITQLSKNIDKEFDLSILGVLSYYFIPFDTKQRPLPFEKYFENNPWLYYLHSFDPHKKDEMLKKSAYEYHLEGGVKYIESLIEKGFLIETLSYFDYFSKKYPDTLEKYIMEYKIYNALNLEIYGFSKLKNLLNIVEKKVYKETTSLNKPIINLFSKKLTEYQKFIFLKENPLLTQKNRVKLYEEYIEELQSSDKEELLLLYWEQGEFNSYKKLLHSLLKEIPLHYNYNIKWLRVLTAQQQYDKAIEHYKKNELILKDAPEVLLLMGEIYQLKNDYQQANLFFEKYLEFNPSDHKIYKYLQDDGKKVDFWALSYQKTLDDEFKNTINKKWNAPAYFLYDYTFLKLKEDYSYQTYRSFAVKIESKEALQYYNQVPIYYAPEDEEIIYSEMFLVKKDGSKIKIQNYNNRFSRSKQNGAFMNYSQRVYSIGNLEVGDTIQLSYYLNRKNIYHESFFGSTYNIQSGIAKNLSIFGFIIPDSMTLYFNKNMESKYGFKYFIPFTSIGDMTTESMQTGYTDNYLYLSVTSFKEWKEMITWYKNLIKGGDDIPTEIANEIKKMTDGLSLKEKIQKIQEYVFKNTHYVGIELGINSYKPFSATEVLDRKFGDCKDKANLLNSLLKVVNIDAYMVLVRAGRIGRIKLDENPNPRDFNHAISYIPSLDLYIDSTAEFNGLDSLPEGNQGAYSLIIADGKVAQYIPIFQEKEVVNVKGIKKENNLEATIKISLNGSRAATTRYIFQNREKQLDIVKEYLKPKFGDSTITDLLIDGLENIQSGLSYQFKIVIKDFFKNRRVHPTLFLKDLSNQLRVLPERKTEMKIPYYQLNETIEISGVEGDNLKKENSLNGDFIKLLQKTELKNGVLNYQTDFQFTLDRVSTTEYPKFRDEIRKVDEIILKNEFYLK
ncbi:DUF3857 domain-containing protein [bacterium]|nr:DUF3857 domain-containing protein [bacterium]